MKKENREVIIYKSADRLAELSVQQKDSVIRNFRITATKRKK